MNPKPEISDHEIDRYMNFPELLRKQHLSRHKTKSWIWVGSATLMIAIVSGWYFTPGTDNVPVKPSPSMNALPLPSAVDSIKHAPEGERTPTAMVPDVKRHEVGTSAPLSKPEVPAADKKARTNDALKVDVYIQAEPIDGYNVLYGYLNSNIKYPVNVVADSIQGVVTVSFVIDKNGAPSSIEATSSMPRVFNDEAIRLIKNMPPWKPATLNGIPVQSKISLPVTFQVQSFQKK